jgi:hypothetical protein
VALADCLPKFVYAPAIGHVMVDDYLGHDALREQDNTPMAQSYADGFLSGLSA